MPFYRISDLLVRIQRKLNFPHNCFEEYWNINFHDKSSNGIRIVANRMTDTTEQISNILILRTRLKFDYFSSVFLLTLHETTDVYF